MAAHRVRGTGPHRHACQLVPDTIMRLGLAAQIAGGPWPASAAGLRARGGTLYRHRGGLQQHPYAARAAHGDRRWTMTYMATSLSIAAGGLIVLFTCFGAWRRNMAAP